MTTPPEALREPLAPFDDPEAAELPPLADPAPARKKGRHFGPRPVADPLDAWLPATRCTKAQREQADAEAGSAGISLNGLVRLRVFGQTGPRVHRNPTELIKAITQLAAQMGRRGGNLNQSSHAFNQIALAAPEATSRDRLADLLEEGMELYRVGIADHRSACADIERTFGGRGDDDY